MAFLDDLRIGSLSGDDPDAKIASLVKQLNDWGRSITTEEPVVIEGSYTVTASGIAGNSKFSMTFNHDQGYRPIITASFGNPSQDMYGMLPYIDLGASTYYGNDENIGGVIAITEVTTSTVTVTVSISDLLFLSRIVAQQTLYFKFYCKRETFPG